MYLKPGTQRTLVNLNRMSCPDESRVMTGISPMSVQRPKPPLACPNTSSQGLVLTRRVQSFVRLPVHPESGVAQKVGRSPILLGSDLMAFDAVLLAPLDLEARETAVEYQ